MDTETKATLGVINHFNDAFNQHDVDAIMDAMTDDVVFENTMPRPDGEPYEGQAAVRGFWEQLFHGSPTPISRPKTYSPAETTALCDGSTPGRTKMGRKGTYAAWMSFVSATARWPRSSLT